MINVVVVWADQDAAAFEHHIPLLWLGKRTRKIGSTATMHLLFLEGMDQLGERYLEELKELGYIPLDCSERYLQLGSSYSQLDRFGDYEKKCFLRWLVIQECFDNEPLIHYDGDIIFNETPEIIASTFGDKTFVLHGCPAFISTGTRDWLGEYRRNLDFFVADIDGYSRKAWQERNGWQRLYKEKWAGSRFRKVIASDQDFISHLIHTGRLPQDIPEDILATTNLLLFTDPLYFAGHYNELLPIAYERIDGVDIFNGRKVAFWHMQSDFVRYLTVFRKRGLLNRFARCPNHLEGVTFENLFWRGYNRLLNIRLNRLDLYRFFFEQHDLTGLFNEQVFWQPSVFVGKAH